MDRDDARRRVDTGLVLRLRILAVDASFGVRIVNPVQWTYAKKDIEWSELRHDRQGIFYYYVCDHVSPGTHQGQQHGQDLVELNRTPLLIFST